MFSFFLVFTIQAIQGKLRRRNCLEASGPQGLKAGLGISHNGFIAGWLLDKGNKLQ